MQNKNSFSLVTPFLDSSLNEEGDKAVRLCRREFVPHQPKP